MSSNLAPTSEWVKAHNSLKEKLDNLFLGLDSHRRHLVYTLLIKHMTGRETGSSSETYNENGNILSLSLNEMEDISSQLRFLYNRFGETEKDDDL